MDYWTNIHTHHHALNKSFIQEEEKWENHLLLNNKTPWYTWYWSRQTYKYILWYWKYFFNGIELYFYRSIHSTCSLSITLLIIVSFLFSLGGGGGVTEKKIVWERGLELYFSSMSIFLRCNFSINYFENWVVFIAETWPNSFKRGCANKIILLKLISKNLKYWQ